MLQLNKKLKPYSEISVGLNLNGLIFSSKVLKNSIKPPVTRKHTHTQTHTLVHKAWRKYKLQVELYKLLGINPTTSV